MVWGGINGIEPPYVVRVRGLKKTPKDVQDGVQLLRNLLAETREEFKTANGHDVEVSMEIID